jgi:methylenetetrahydrofolate reductase (NADPH)
MPIKDVDQIKRFTNMCGAKIPQDLLDRLEAVKGDPGGVIHAGIEYAYAQCEDLLKKGVPGIHFYTLNKSQSTYEIFKRLKSAHLKTGVKASK